MKPGVCHIGASIVFYLKISVSRYYLQESIFSDSKISVLHCYIRASIVFDSQISVSPYYTVYSSIYCL